MFGVVLWSDEQENKAVIWCEDHGDLAFYRKSECDDQVTLDAGDWVQFDMTMDRHLRFARNPRLVDDGVYRNLADALGAAAPQLSASSPIVSPPPALAQADRNSATIIPFAQAQATRRSRAADTPEMITA